MPSVQNFSVVIATRNRPEALAECLIGVFNQSVLPFEIIVVDSSNDNSTAEACKELANKSKSQVLYVKTPVVGAARQRNVGINHVRTEITVFLDDDIIPYDRLFEHLLKPFSLHNQCSLGGVAGTNVNEVSQPPKKITRVFLRGILGVDPFCFPGKLIGPAVHVNYGICDAALQEVDWMPATCSAYWTEDVRAVGFAECFQGYSFMEDVELSSRIGRAKVLYQATHARLYHKGLGGQRKRGWYELGISYVTNRHYVMTDVLGRRGWSDLARLLLYELLYMPITDVVTAARGGQAWRAVGEAFAGRVVAGVRVLWKGSPYKTRRNKNVVRVQSQ